MKHCFIEKKFSAASTALLDCVNEILDRYAEQGFTLTLRQIYYQFIAKDLFPDSWIDEAYNLKWHLDPRTKNTKKNYKRLGALIGDGRLAGVIDWDMIEDRGREMVENAHWESPAEIISEDAKVFRIDKWENQPCYVEVMVEKDALAGVLTPVCKELDVPFTANRGYSSLSAVYVAGQRMLQQLQNEKQVHVFYLGDHDPSGMDMTRDLEERLRMFTASDPSDEIGITVHRVALTMGQITAMHLPENPTKQVDPRAKSYSDQFDASWELDAIEPQQLAELVRHAVRGVRDPDQWNKDVAREEKMKADLRKFAKTYKVKQ